MVLILKYIRLKLKEKLIFCCKVCYWVSYLFCLDVMNFILMCLCYIIWFCNVFMLKYIDIFFKFFLDVFVRDWVIGVILWWKILYGKIIK